MAEKPTAEKPAKTTGGKGTEVAGRDAPNKGDVWVNTESKIYHREGDQWYGKTKSGKYMTEDDAKAAGFRASK